MIRLPFRDDSGTPVDVRFEVESTELILHSGAGAVDSLDARNEQYGMVLRLVLQRIKDSDLTLAGVRMDSTGAGESIIGQRQVFFTEDAEASPEELAGRFLRRMTSIDHTPNALSDGGSSTENLRFAFAGSPPDERIARVVGWGKTGTTKYHDRELPSTAFDPVREYHVWNAVQRLAAQGAKHSFGESTDYDVIWTTGLVFLPRRYSVWRHPKPLDFRSDRGISQEGSIPAASARSRVPDTASCEKTKRSRQMTCPWTRRCVYGSKAIEVLRCICAVNAVQAWHAQRNERSRRHAAACVVNDAT